MESTSARLLHVIAFSLAVGALGCDCNASTVPPDDAGNSQDIDANVATDANVDADADVDGAIDDAAVDAAADASSTDAGPTDAGPDASGTPSCSGNPTSCTALSGISCQIQDGCAAVDAGVFSCSGSPNPCASYASFVACTVAGTIGCSWTGTPGAGTCGGAPSACATRNSNTCVEGCVAAGACAGTATPCAGLAQNACLAQMGCAWQ